MEAEAEKLKVLQSEVEKQMHMGDAAGKEGFHLIFLNLALFIKSYQPYMIILMRFSSSCGSVSNARRKS